MKESESSLKIYFIKENDKMTELEKLELIKELTKYFKRKNKEAEPEIEALKARIEVLLNEQTI